MNLQQELTKYIDYSFKYNGEELVVVNTSYGRKLCFRRRGNYVWFEWVIPGANKFTNGPFQGSNIKFIRKHIAPVFNNLAIDIGANLGMNTVEYADIFKKVVSFEPHPITFRCLEESVSANYLKNVKLFNKGIGRKKNKTFISDKNEDGHNVISKSGFDVELMRLDSLKLKPDFIKIDVEGYEFEALLGSKKTIEQNRPVVQVEVDDEHMQDFGQKPQDIWDYFTKIDYKACDRYCRFWPEWRPKTFNEKGNNNAGIGTGIMDWFFFPQEKISFNLKYIEESLFNDMFDLK